MKILLPFALLAVVLYGLGSALVPLLLAAIAALLCDPFMQWLKTKGIKKPYSTLLVIVGVFLPMIIVNVILVPIVLREAKEFLTVLPENMTRLLDQVESWAVAIGVSLEYDRTDVLGVVEAHIGQFSGSLLKSLGSALKQSAGNLTQVLLTILNLFLVPIFFFYLVTEKNYWLGMLNALIPRQYHAHVLETFRKSESILKSYLQGQVLACLILATVYAGSLFAAGLKFGVLIGIITGSLSFIPYVGFSIGLALGLIVALTTGGGVGYVALIFAIFMAGQALETFIVTPKFVGNNVGLTPLESILVLIILGNFFGFIGMIVAIPAGAILKTTLTEYVATQHR